MHLYPGRSVRINGRFQQASVKKKKIDVSYIPLMAVLAIGEELKKPPKTTIYCVRIIPFALFPFLSHTSHCIPSFSIFLRNGPYLILLSFRRASCLSNVFLSNRARFPPEPRVRAPRPGTAACGRRTSCPLPLPPTCSVPARPPIGYTLPPRVSR